MFNWYKKCEHPLDSLSPIGTVTKALIVPAKTHYRNVIRFHCTKCDTRIVRTWNSMTPEMLARVQSHGTDIEAAIMYGAGTNFTQIFTNPLKDKEK